MKRANGEGSIEYIGGEKRRRNPWRVRIVLGWDEGKRVRKTIGCYPTKKEAAKALAAYHINPIPQTTSITFKEAYDEWSATSYPKLSKSTADTYRAAYLHLEPIYNKPMKDLRSGHIQIIIDNCEKSRSTLANIRSVCNQVATYCMQNDIIQKNYVEFVRLEKKEKVQKEIFSDDEIAILKENDNVPYVDIILILLYTGMRITELLTLPKNGIDFVNNTITGGIKTNAGKNRVIPIHPLIIPYIKKWYTSSVSAPTLIQKDDKPITSNNFREDIYKPLLQQLGIQYKTPHCTRHTFATMLAKSGADINAIKQIIGHANYATTADIYTHTDVDFLKKAMGKI